MSYGCLAHDFGDPLSISSDILPIEFSLDLV